MLKILESFSTIVWYVFAIVIYVLFIATNFKIHYTFCIDSLSFSLYIYHSFWTQLFTVTVLYIRKVHCYITWFFWTNFNRVLLNWRERLSPDGSMWQTLPNSQVLRKLEMWITWNSASQVAMSYFKRTKV